MVNREQRCLALILAIGLITSLPSGASEQPAEAAPSALRSQSTADHSTFEALAQRFKSGRELTKACLSCHNLAAKQVHTSTHWNWEFTNEETGQSLGKRNLLNSTLISVSSNGPYCARCHIGNEWTEETFDFSAEEQVDCLACHDTTGTYASKKMHQLRVKCSACHVEFDKSKSRDVVRKPNLSELAKRVGKPNLASCGSCHFYSDGGDGIKHGDLDTSLLSASRHLDVHMAKDGLDYSCTTCHKAEGHQMRGTRYAPEAKDTHGIDVVGGSRATCESCHGLAPHPDSANVKLNDHVDRIACQTCHIPALARGGRPTKTYWDWSTAGRLNDAGKEIVEKDGEGRIIYSSQRGGSQWSENLVPDYVWFNGKIEYLTMDDKIDPASVVQLNTLAGSSDDPESRIWPVKTLRGKQPIDAINETLASVRLFGKKDDAFWKAYDWTASVGAGMKAAGREFSGKVGFVETEMRNPVNHTIAPAEDSLTCVSCHSRNGRMAGVPGIFMPGTGTGAILDIFGLLLIGSSVLVVLGHGTLRVLMKVRNNGRRRPS
ncbi:MAG: tetrathionate reductase family octaheme c-type cytochrome [Arenicellales bacterium]|nr:tetrathionate reductase family octaheme c-type cytochrome [Arenicellales bacterium]